MLGCKKNSFYILLVFLFYLFPLSQAYAWPFGNKKEKTSPAPQPAAISQNKPLEDEFFFDEEESQDSGESQAPEIVLPSIPKIPQNPARTGLPVIPKAPSVSSLNISPGVSNIGTAGRDAELLRIQQQINDIIKINENLKSLYSEQAAEIQKISEQAKIHQKILQDLEEGKKDTAVPANADSFLNQEKLKLIQKETEKNRKFIDSLQSSSYSKKETSSIEKPV